MRAPFQILAIPYKAVDGKLLYCVFHRSDQDQWQFIAGGGEGDETPIQAAQREICEESGIHARNIISLRSVCSVPTDIFPNKHLYNWAADTYVVPEYSFGFACTDAIQISHEHMEYAWLPYEEARSRLTWDSNRTALYELNCRLKEHKSGE
ncbi:MAG TPA: NUDIX pyrophosphatase [Candidatus Eubacterium faecipullorum]|uniref:NUDIX pyrophosphatase n=1 Tax=Candidatus Eubacterium faecipullorum TaxID=2838571 RepID=A0A9D1RCQ6_9FIRM|nr:NUDIX pyrophosphatase [Candidatus Eubacterium faecipullorum]